MELSSEIVDQATRGIVIRSAIESSPGLLHSGDALQGVRALSHHSVADIEVSGSRPELTEPTSPCRITSGQRARRVRPRSHRLHPSSGPQRLPGQLGTLAIRAPPIQTTMFEPRRERGEHPTRVTRSVIRFRLPLIQRAP